MSDAELSRLRHDLDVIQHAAGLELPFGWWEVWQTLGLVPSGAIIVAWAAFGPWDYILVSVLPCILLALVAAGRSVLQYRRHLGGHQERKVELIATVIFIVAIACLIVWEGTLGLPKGAVRGAAFFLAGAMCIVLACTSRARRAYFAGVALIPFALALPLCTTQQIVLVGGFAMMAAGVIAATIMAGQLRADRRSHEPSTH
jgi:hypothetical protein